ncbi:MAG: RES family NAD+ phosphorylase [Acidobacteriota bacterium]
MSFLPRPDSARLEALTPPIATLDGDRLIWRVYRSAGRHPTTWDGVRFVGPLPSRFDHHLGSVDAPRRQERGVYYCAPDLRTALAEVFQVARHCDLEHGAPRAAAFFPARPLQVLDLWSPWTTRVGCDQRIHTTPARESTRRWARALYEAYPRLDGLRYRSKMAGGVAWCLVERGADAFPAVPVLDRPLTDPALRPAVESAAGSLGYSVS